MIKLLEYNFPLGWGNSKFVLEIDGQKHFVVENLICGHWCPEGSFYYEVDENYYYDHHLKPLFKKLIYQNCKQIGKRSYMSEGYEPINVVLEIGTIATVARVLQGYSVEPTGYRFNTFLNDDVQRQAIVYPYSEMDWDKFKDINAAYREQKIFEETKQELLGKGYTQNKSEFWILDRNV